MTKEKTSYEEKNKKEERKIIFEEFPYKKEKNNNKKIKNVIITILIIIILLVLFTFSSILNKYILYGNESNDYKIVNNFDGNYAKISPQDRQDLFKKIGFDVSKTKTEIKDNNNYVTTYAYHNNSDDNLFADSISVYYDGNYEVTYIILSLVYSKNDFSIASATADCNAIIKNFAIVTTPKNAISEVFDNGYYYLGKNDANADVSYRLIKQDKYYLLTVTLEK